MHILRSILLFTETCNAGWTPRAEQTLQFPGTAAVYYKGDGSPYQVGTAGDAVWIQIAGAAFCEILRAAVARRSFMGL